MKRKMYVLGVAAVLAALLALSGVAQSAMWVGGEIGGNFNSANVDVTVGPFSGSKGVLIQPSVIGGATLGYDFVNSGFGAYAWPDWMKYFSFAMDLTYNKLEVHSLSAGSFSVLSPNSRLNGYEIAWTFLFMAHYGFMPDSEVPGGRINPYLGVGPAIVWSGADFTANVLTPSAGGSHGFSSNFGVNAMNIALVVEPGIRWVCFKNVSVDTAMRWRYAVPSWSDGPVTVKLPINQFAFILRANYHF